MLFINQLLSETDLLPELPAAYSLACISTTRPIYLVFEPNALYPAYVIRELDSPSAIHSNIIHRKLYSLASNLVPEPIGVYEHRGTRYEVQRGVKGEPWFQIRSKLSTVEAQANLETRMWQTLHEFQAAIVSEARGEANTLQPHTELSKAYASYLETGEQIDAGLEALVEHAIKELSLCESCPKIPQHGDFCLNNLIINHDHITVIDFEDFSITEMPLYDHFTLGLSLLNCYQTPSSAAGVFNHPKIIAVAGVLEIPPRVLRWHFLHHLLLRLGPWSCGEQRATYRSWLKLVLRDFIKLSESSH